jgi:inosine triphosphate pyrophosphatase
MKLLFITGNEHKAREAKQILAGFDVEARALHVHEIQSLDPKVIIREKLEEARKQVKEQDDVIFVEDVSFWVGDLGLPGPLMKFFEETLKPAGIVTFARAFNVDTARAECNIGVLLPGKSEPLFFTGTSEGHLVEPRGSNGFGFDSIFIPEGHTQTFAQMPPEEKHAISHRSRALAQLAEFLKNL